MGNINGISQARHDRHQDQHADTGHHDLGRAEQHGLTPAQLAIAYVVGRPFVTSSIIGATTAEQLRSNIESATIRLDANVIAGIDVIHTRQPNPIQ